MNISVWRPAGSTYAKVSEYTIQQPLHQNGVTNEGVYVQISVNISVPMPVQRGDILGLSLPTSESAETAISVLAQFNDSKYIGLSTEAESCWQTEEGQLSDCHVLDLTAHPVLAVYLTDYEEGKNSFTVLKQLSINSYNYRMWNLQHARV